MPVALTFVLFVIISFFLIFLFFEMYCNRSPLLDGWAIYGSLISMVSSGFTANTDSPVRQHGCMSHH